MSDALKFPRIVIAETDGYSGQMRCLNCGTGFGEAMPHATWFCEGDHWADPARDAQCQAANEHWKSAHAVGRARRCVGVALFWFAKLCDRLSFVAVRAGGRVRGAGYRALNADQVLEVSA